MADERKTRADSVAGELDAWAAAAEGLIEPPKSVKLRGEADRRVWDAIVRARARDEWSDIDLHHAANLTRCLSDIERISDEIAVEGDTLENARGTKVANPKHALLEVLSRRSVALTRLLGLHAAVLVGDPRKTLPAREAEEEARQEQGRLADDDDDLLARPGSARTH